MKKINPFYVLALLALTLFFVIQSSHRMEKNIASAAAKNVELEKTGKELKQLRQNWDDKEAMISKIQTLQSQKQLTTKISDKGQKGEIYKLSLQNLDAKEADMLADKLFNSFLKINYLRFEESDQNISAAVEFGL